MRQTYVSRLNVRVRHAAANGFETNSRKTGPRKTKGNGEIVAERRQRNSASIAVPGVDGGCDSFCSFEHSFIIGAQNKKRFLIKSVYLYNKFSVSFYVYELTNDKLMFLNYRCLFSLRYPEYLSGDHFERTRGPMVM